MYTRMVTGTTQVKRRGLPIETSLVATCCVCGLIRGKKAHDQDADRWVTKRTYEQTYGVSLFGSPFTHTYCAGCHADFMQRAKPAKSQHYTHTTPTRPPTEDRQGEMSRDTPEQMMFRTGGGS
jgi:hypothetical protein